MRALEVDPDVAALARDVAVDADPLAIAAPDAAAGDVLDLVAGDRQIRDADRRSRRRVAAPPLDALRARVERVRGDPAAVRERDVDARRADPREGARLDHEVVGIREAHAIAGAVV